jgi:hypothetical protein
MKSNIIAVAFMLALWAFCYGLGAFVAWEPNPGNWTEKGRELLAFWFVVSAVLAGMARAMP